MPKWKAYIGINGKSQGSAGDVCKNAMIGVWEYITQNGLQDTLRLIINVHDELVFEIRKGADRQIMRNVRDIMRSAGDPVGMETPVNVSRVNGGWNRLTNVRTLNTKN